MSEVAVELALGIARLLTARESHLMDYFGTNPVAKTKPMLSEICCPVRYPDFAQDFAIWKRDLHAIKDGRLLAGET